MGDNQEQKVMIIAPSFFEYETKIEEAVQKAGYKVSLISESIDNVNFINRILTHYFPNCKLTKNVYDRYYSKNITSDNMYVLVIRGGLLTKDIINKIRLINAKAKFILYQWDCVELNPNALKIANCFDEVCTFDINDSKNFGWRYVPLFHLNPQNHGGNKEYITFIGSMHTKRAVIAREIHKLCQDTDNKCFVYLYTTFMSLLKQKFILKNGVYKGVNINDLYYRPLPLKKVLDIYGKTKVMIDYTTPCQSGFSTRTMESLSYQYKLVTNNIHIKEADFYDKANIYVYSEDDFKIPVEFLNSEYRLLDKNLYEKYSIDNWVKNILL